MKILTALLLPIAIFSTGCTDKYKEGYDEGYAAGVEITKRQLQDEFDRKVAQIERDSRYSSSSYSSVTSTEVCGGSGVNLNGKHYSGGKTGCVRVHSDGKVEKY